VGLWNHFSTISHNTNNHLEEHREKEDDHEKSPNIYKAVELFKIEKTLKHTQNTWILKPRNQPDWRLEMMICDGIHIIC